MTVPSAVAVFCGSSSGLREEYAVAARSLGTLLAERSITLVYGGGSVGLMGEVADAAMAAGGRVHGVITESLLAAEVGHRGLSALDVVASMHERKQRMAELVDGFVVLPGGFGTWDETCEVLTWSQLGIHRKPVVLVDTLGFWDHLVALTEHATAEGFVRPQHRPLLRVVPDAMAALDALDEPLPPAVTKWSGSPPSVP